MKHLWNFGNNPYKSEYILREQIEIFRRGISGKISRGTHGEIFENSLNSEKKLGFFKETSS